MAGILVVDDSLSIRQSLKLILEGESHNVLEAENGEEGLRILRRHKNDIDLVMVDVHMPVMNGLSMIKEINCDPSGRYPKIPILVITTEDDKSLQELAKLSGIKGWCLKPVSGEQIKYVLGKVLES